jgi:hypothetical protein
MAAFPDHHRLARWRRYATRTFCKTIPSPEALPGATAISHPFEPYLTDEAAILSKLHCMLPEQTDAKTADTRRTARLAAALVCWILPLATTAPVAAAPQEAPVPARASVSAGTRTLPSSQPAGQPTPPPAGFQPAGPVIDGPPAPVPPATINRDASGGATVRAVRLDEPLRLDGVLDEPIYARVEPFGDFIQQSPDEGAPASEGTDNWILFDDESIYVGARVYESVPESAWVANEMQRDSFRLINNDGYIVVFDTFYDRRNGFTFRVNPIGGFQDQQITDEGNPNPDWNPVWDVRTGRFDGGWTVEMEIPFQSLRFRPGPNQVWGIQLGRDIRSNYEEAYLTAVPISAGPGQFRLSVAGTLVGLEVPADSRTFEIKPYAIGSLNTDRTVEPPISNDGDGSAGVDVKYGLTENLTADFTYNTDFAQVEVDEQQINLTRFSLFFPEKREFFLEGQGIFDFGRVAGFGGFGGSARAILNAPPGVFPPGDAPTLFFSRRIGLDEGRTVPIVGGGRLTGKVGDFSVGAINIQTDDARTSDILPTNFSVLRVKRDILRRSRIGAIFTNRSVSTRGDGANQAYGLDGSFSFYDNVNLYGYYARTNTPDLEGKNESYQAAFSYEGDLYGLLVDHLQVGKNFNPEIGFMRREDFRRSYVYAQFSPRPEGIEAVRQFTWGGSVDYIENGAGQLETRILSGRFQTNFENSDSLSADIQQDYEFLPRPFEIIDGVTIPVGGYEFTDFQVSYSMGPHRRVAGGLSFQHGEFFAGDITAVGYSRGLIEVSRQFAVEPSVSWNRITLPQGDFTARVATTRLTYTFTPRMFASALLQYNSTNHVLSTNVRLRWEYQPGSELFVVYNDQRDTFMNLRNRGFPMLENRAFVVKFTRQFRF